MSYAVRPRFESWSGNKVIRGFRSPTCAGASARVRGHRKRNVEQLVARAVWDREAGGSSPFIPTWRLGFEPPVLRQFMSGEVAPRRRPVAQ